MNSVGGYKKTFVLLGAIICGFASGMLAKLSDFTQSEGVFGDILTAVGKHTKGLVFWFVLWTLFVALSEGRWLAPVNSMFFLGASLISYYIFSRYVWGNYDRTFAKIFFVIVFVCIILSLLAYGIRHSAYMRVFSLILSLGFALLDFFFRGCDSIYNLVVFGLLALLEITALGLACKKVHKHPGEGLTPEEKEYFFGSDEDDDLPVEDEPDDGE